MEIRISNTTLARLILAALFMACAIPAFSTVIVDENSPPVIDIQKSVYVLEDKDASLSIKNILSEDRQNKFKRNEDGKTNFGYTRSALWIKIEINYALSQQKRMYLQFKYPPLDHIKFYSPSPDGSYSRTVTGDTLPFKERHIRSRFYYFPIHSSEGKSTYYLRLINTGPVKFPLSLIDFETLDRQDHDDQIFYGAFLGLSLIHI